jgi:hypothetical protein
MFGYRRCLVIRLSFFFFFFFSLTFGKCFIDLYNSKKYIISLVRELFGKYVISLRKHNQLVTKHFHAPSRLKTNSYIKNRVNCLSHKT